MLGRGFFMRAPIGDAGDRPTQGPASRVAAPSLPAGGGTKMDEATVFDRRTAYPPRSDPASATRPHHPIDCALTH